MSRGSVLVTGSSSGIGQACVTRLAAAGFDVLAGIRRRPGAGSPWDGAAGVTAVQLDVTDAAEIAAAFEAVKARLGEGRLLGLVNNAGISGGGLVETSPVEDFRNVLETNLVGAAAVTHAFLPLVGDGGRIVNVGSGSGRRPMPFLAAYSASKAGLAAFSYSLGLELRPRGVKVVLVEPGAIHTPIWDRGLAEWEQRVAQIPPPTRALYETPLARLRAGLEQRARGGTAPDAVARAVERALTSRRPRARYTVGLDAKLQAFLPSGLHKALVARALGLGNGNRAGMK
jgi:NAD(P)-dependent dehydrogenase (short-subunit alcohol dehydrogenase family)